MLIMALPAAAARSAGILALLPFLVEGALSLHILRALRARGVDVAIAYCLAETGGYARDLCTDFADENRLIDFSSLHPRYQRDRLQRECDERGIRLILQIGAFSLYPVLPYLKEHDPRLRIIDILYNEIGHTVNHFAFETCFDGVIVESQHMARFVRDCSLKPDPNVRVVENGIDLERFSPSSRPPEPGRLRIGYIGRLSPEKNPLGFVTLAERLAQRLPGLSAFVAGDGPMTDEVRKHVAASPAADRLTYLGRVESVATLRDIDVLVVPSTLDGRPNVVMEASACGVPVIGAPVGGIPELINDGVNGYLASPAEVDRIASWLSAWADDPRALAAMRASCREMAESRFDRRRMITEYAEAFAHYSDG